jgi:Zn-dependent metalloprotease
MEPAGCWLYLTFSGTAPMARGLSRHARPPQLEGVDVSSKSGMLSLAIAAALFANGASNAAEPTQPAVDRALQAIHAHPAAARASSRDGYVARDLTVDPDGTEHLRFARTYAGLPVIGGDLVVHSRDGLLRSISLTQRAPIDLSVQPAIDADDAVVAAGVEFGAGFTVAPESALVVRVAPRIGARLAWRVRLQDRANDMTYLVDARDGTILARWSNLETADAAGTARTLYSGDVALVTDSVPGGYALRDATRGGTWTMDGSNSRTSGRIYTDADNAWGDYTTTDRATAAADAQYGAAATWDYYKDVHGREGIAGDGKGAYNRVHYGRRYANAYWSDACFCMTYGDGDGFSVGPMVALDITGHEMSHGVDARTAGLVYDGESGGLNEANSDIFGTMVEFHADNPQDTPDYMIGEEIFLGNVPGSADQQALRYMFHPSLDGTSPDCWFDGIGDLDVHFSSGVANHFFYLLAEGTEPKTFSGVLHASPTCNGATLAGIGRDKAQRIWYRALTVYFTQDTDYAGARVATIAAAEDLYGTGSAEAVAVAASWSAVDVL